MSRVFRESSLSTYDFATFYTALPHNLINEQLTGLIKRAFQREGSPYLACIDKNAFFTSDDQTTVQTLVLVKRMRRIIF